jgi:hypothetical protein
MAHEIAGAAPCTGEKPVYPAVASAISEATVWRDIHSIARR